MRIVGDDPIDNGGVVDNGIRHGYAYLLRGAAQEGFLFCGHGQ